MRARIFEHRVWTFTLGPQRGFTETCSINTEPTIDDS